MEWMILPYRRYFDFSGRSTRREYWLFYLFYMLVLTGIFIMAFGIGLGAADRHTNSGAVLVLGVFGVLVMVFLLGTLIPALALMVRRLHDQDRSGLFVLISFIPFGGLVLLIMMLLGGTRGPNRYGPDPRDSSHASVFD